MKIEILTLCATPTHMKIKQITQIRYYVGMKMLWLLLLFGLLQFGNSLCRADLSPEEVSRVTTEIQKFEPKWTDKQTQEATSRGRNGLAMSAYGSFRLKVEGDTVWVNGKQITGNLGTNITYKNSPTIVNPQNSQFAIGDNAKVVSGSNNPIIENSASNQIVVGNDSTVNSSKGVSIGSLALTVTLPLAAAGGGYLIWRQSRKKKRS